MVGHVDGVQNSVTVPYSMFRWLKKSTVLTASHSFRSSPSGNNTAPRKLPEPSVASAYRFSWYCLVPSGMLRLGLKVRVLDRPKKDDIVHD